MDDLYKHKAKDSFKTKLNLYLFSYAIGEVEELSKATFNEFQITDSLIDTYTTKYWQYETHELLMGKPIKEIISTFEKNKEENVVLIEELEEEYVNNTFSSVFLKEGFDDLVKEKKCAYCGITKKKIDKFRSGT